MVKVLAILGPTATGKTDLALNLAKKFNGELISCDSRQVYQGLDIGTGKLPGKNVEVKRGRGFWEMDGVNVWMYDVVQPKVQYTVKDYVNQGNKVLADIIKKGKLPIIVGGTGLYFKALTSGLSNLNIPTDRKLRGKLERLSLEELQIKLKSLSPTDFQKMNNSDRNNKRRLLRSIELILMNPYKETIQKSKNKRRKYNILKVGLIAPRQILKDRIYSRLLSRIDQGLMKEGEELYKDGLALTRMEELGLEYGMLAELLGGLVNKNQFIDQLSVKIYQYSKRQMTWFKKEPGVNWFDITGLSWEKEVEKLVTSWYDLNSDQTN